MWDVLGGYYYFFSVVLFNLILSSFIRWRDLKEECLLSLHQGLAALFINSLFPFISSRFSFRIHTRGIYYSILLTWMYIILYNGLYEFTYVCFWIFIKTKYLSSVICLYLIKIYSILQWINYQHAEVTLDPPVSDIKRVSLTKSVTNRWFGAAIVSDEWRDTLNGNLSQYCCRMRFPMIW